MTRFALLAALIAGAVACTGADASPTAVAAAQPLAEEAYAAPPLAEDAYVAPPADNAAAPPLLLASHTGVSCEIYRARTLHGLRLEASVSGLDAANAPLDYEFVVTKRGPSGSSDIMQSGEVSEADLGAVDLSLDRGDRFHATLILRDAFGEVCAAELSS